MFKVSPSVNKILKQGIVALFIILVAVISMGALFKSSAYFTDEGHFITQPIPFSHRLHTDDLGMDCTFCHTQVERAENAGMPSVETCYGCHKEILRNVKLLDPVRAAYHSGHAMQWNRVNRLPDHVHFNHSKHIKAGVSCIHCHGDAKKLPLEAKQQNFTMQWCLDCHRVQSPMNQRLQDCYTCHR